MDIIIVVPSEAIVTKYAIHWYMIHMRSPSNQQPLMSIIWKNMRRPTNKSDTARERRRRLVGVWSCLWRNNRNTFYYISASSDIIHRGAETIAWNTRRQTWKKMLMGFMNWSRICSMILNLKCEMEMITSRLRITVSTEIQDTIMSVNMTSKWGRCNLLQEVLTSCGKQSSVSSITTGGRSCWTLTALWRMFFYLLPLFPPPSSSLCRCFCLYGNWCCVSFVIRNNQD